MNQLISEIQVWVKLRTDKYRQIGKAKTSMLWMISSMHEFVLNLLDSISCMFITDITRCYENIPLEGPDNLPDALGFITKAAFTQRSLKNGGKE